MVRSYGIPIFRVNMVTNLSWMSGSVSFWNFWSQWYWQKDSFFTWISKIKDWGLFLFCCRFLFLLPFSSRQNTVDRGIILELRQTVYAKMCLLAYANSEGPNQPAQSDQSIHYPLTEPLDTKNCRNGEQRPGPSCSKRHQLSKLVKGHFFNCLDWIQ